MNIDKVLKEVDNTKVYYDFALGACQKNGHLLIKGIRERYKWSQRQLAELLDCTDGYVSKIECRHIQISVPVILRLAEIIKEMEDIDDDFNE